MMEMIANYGNPISPQPPPFSRSFDDPGLAEPRGPSFQDYLKTSRETESSTPSQEGRSLDQPSREQESKAPADQAERDKPSSLSGEKGLQDSRKTENKKGDKTGADENREALPGKALKRARSEGEKSDPEIPAFLLKRGSVPDEGATEKIPGVSRKSPKDTEPVGGEELISRTEASLPREEGEDAEAGSFLLSLSGAQAVSEEGNGPRNNRKATEPGEAKVKPGAEGAVKVAGSSSSDVARLKIVSAENPENSIEVSLTDARGRGKAGTAALRHDGGEAAKKDDTVLGSSEAPRSAEPEGGNVRVLELGGDSQERSGTPAAFSAKETKSAAASFGEILREKGINQVVRQTGILLKDENRGEIKLILKPESLGKVRIQLNLEDNRIAGRILVENSNVRDVFNQNMDELQRALRESGFESAHLEVSVEGEASGQNQEGRRDPLRNQRMIAQAIEDGLPGMITLQREDSLVNLMA